MSLRERYRFDELNNIAEDLVIAELEKQLSARSLLDKQNNDTIQDMCAFALNLVPPMYRANLLGRVYVSAFKDEYKAEIERAVGQAIEKIMANPPIITSQKD